MLRLNYTLIQLLHKKTTNMICNLTLTMFTMYGQKTNLTDTLKNIYFYFFQFV